PPLTVAANVAYGPRCAGLSRSAARAVADRWLAAVEATDLAERKPAQLSGGQAQRVALARALAAEPQLLLLDEPLSALDVTAAPAMRRLLRTMLREKRRTAIIVTHDLLDALAVADDVAVIEGGRVVEHGPARKVLTTPRSDFAARIAGINLIAGRIARPGTIRTAWGTEISGTGDLEPGTDAVALCRPSAVAVFTTIPHGSPRNVVAVSIAEMEVHGETVRIRGEAQPDGGTGLAADVTAAAVADLELEPGATAYFAVKAQEVQLHPVGAVGR
ncbi:ATP-binding cassette domain-containing protein, partial [Mycolicibacterium poriferae]|uniref:ATP-binding cassette domain-containing protein n=1 Tax=Mycolicibacterium poriferae TaxID=39694 RepID=UPI0024BA43AD